MIINNKFCIAVLFILFSMFFLCNPLHAQTGKIKGVVLDKSTKDPLIGANIMVDGTSIGAASDINGEFIIPNVPAGNKVLKVSYIGYFEQKIDMELFDGRITFFRVELESNIIELSETVIVSAQKEGQLKAINQQLTSDQIKNVVSAEKMMEVPDANVAESIARLPGISLQRRSGEGSGVIIRGLAPQYNRIQINGVAIASTGFVGGGSSISVSQERGSDLAVISSENLAGIEVFKAITPDMDAESVGGVVNLQLAKSKKAPQYKLRIYGAYNSLEDDYNQYKAFGRFSQRFFDSNLGVQASINAERRNRGRDRLTANYFDRTNTQDGTTTYLITKAAIEDRLETRKRLGGSLIFDWATGENEFMFSNFYSFTEQNIRYRTHQYGDSQDATFVIPGWRDQELTILSNALKGKHSLFGSQLDWIVAHSFSETYIPLQHEMRFSEKNVGIADVLLDPEEFLRQLPQDENAEFREASSDQILLNERRFEVQLNFNVPFNVSNKISGYFKFGGKYTSIDRKNDRDTGLLVPGGNVPEDPLLHFSNWLDEEYDPGVLLNGLTDLGLITNPELSSIIYDRLNDFYNVSPYHGGNNDYEANENVYAGYVMAKLKYGELITIIPGIRFESDDDKYKAFYRYKTSGWNVPQGTMEAREGTFSDQYWFPMFHLKVKPLSWLDFRFAYTNTIARPNFLWRVPSESFSASSSDWSAGIPSLKPVLSESFDLYSSFYHSSFGLFTIGVFHKNLDNITYLVAWNIHDVAEAEALGLDAVENPLYLGGKGTIPRNLTTTSTLDGFEIDLQTHLFFLPGFLKNFVLNANYTRLFSESQLYSSETIVGPPLWIPTDSIGVREGPIPHQADNIFNITLGYDIGGFSGRFSVFHQGRALVGVGTLAQVDQYSRAFTRMDISLKQKLGENLSLLFNVTNLSNEPDTRTQAGTEKYRDLEFYGAMYDLGVQYEF